MGFLFKWIFRLVLLVIVASVGFGFYLTTLGPDPVVKPERQMSEVWADYPFESHYVTVKGSKMHYIDEGDPDGPVFLFLHGNPTSSYLWRNILPIVAASGVRAIAVDNIGFGASDRPDIGYTFAEHSEYIDGFVETMGLQDVTLVIHDWGSALGFDYAYRNQDNVRGIVFMEAIYRIGSISDLGTVPSLMFRGMRTPGIGEFFVLGFNGFVERILPFSIVREMSEEEMDAYREPFPTFGSRLPTLVWPREIPFDGEPADVAARVNKFVDWLPTSSVPKLIFYFEPGGLISEEIAETIINTWENVDGIKLGAGLHFVQEDHPEEIGQGIVDWASSRFETVAEPEPEDPGVELILPEELLVPPSDDAETE